MNGTTSIMGVSVGPIHGEFEAWSLCDKTQPHQAKLKLNAASQAYGATVLNTTVTQSCLPSATDAGTMIENVAVPYLPSVCVGLPIPKVRTANCNINAIFLLKITRFSGVVCILPAFSSESSPRIWRSSSVLEFSALAL